MPNVFDSVSAINIGTSPVTVFTAVTATMLTSLLLCNVAASGIQVTVQIVDSSSGNTVNILKDVTIPVGSSLPAFDENKPNLMPGDSIRVTASVATAVDAFLSIITDING